MTQTLLDKQAAIKSLLPLLVEHLDCMPMSMVVRRWDENGGGGELDCDGRCEGCNLEQSCGGKWWAEVVKEKLERRYRLKTIRISLRQLEYVNYTQYNAIQICYVDPLDVDWYHLDELWFRVAEDGIRWMADEIPGEVPAYGERRKTLVCQVMERRADGLSIRQIARSLGVKKHIVESLVRCESIPSAVG